MYCMTQEVMTSPQEVNCEKPLCAMVVQTSTHSTGVVSMKTLLNIHFNNTQHFAI
jgi:hypothetical protein